MRQCPGLALERRGIVGCCVIKQKPNRQPIAPNRPYGISNRTVLVELAQGVSRPGHLLKVCSPPDALRSALPGRWHVDLAGDFMTTVRRCESWRVPTSGFAADTSEAFVFDRVLTALDRRRKGLGRALMTALREARRNPTLPELLVATADSGPDVQSGGFRSRLGFENPIKPSRLFLTRWRPDETSSPLLPRQQHM